MNPIGITLLIRGMPAVFMIPIGGMIHSIHAIMVDMVDGTILATIIGIQFMPFQSPILYMSALVVEAAASPKLDDPLDDVQLFKIVRTRRAA